MQDLKSLDDSSELRIGNREVALMVGGLFVVLVVVFGLGVMVGKRIYGQGAIPVAANSSGAASSVSQITQPAPVKVVEHPVSTTTYRYIDEMNGKKTEQPVPPATVQPQPTAAPAPTPQPQPTAAPAATPAGTPQPPKPPQPPAITPPKPTPPATPPAATTPSEPAGDWKWSIQVAAFTNQENADRSVAEYKKKGVEAWLGRLQPATGNPYFIVRIGKFNSLEEAKKELETLKAAGKIPPDSIVRVKQ